MVQTIQKKEYQIKNGTSYHKDTAHRVIQVLENARVTKTRIRVFYGETDMNKSDFGRDWMEEYDTIGYVGRNGGEIKIPLLIKNRVSFGGGAILDHCIVRITEALGGKELYRHTAYYQPELFIHEDEDAPDGYPWRVQTHDDVLAYFPKFTQAKRYKQFLAGERNAK